MKAEDLKGKSEDELNKMLLDLRKAQLNQRFKNQADNWRTRQNSVKRAVILHV